MALTCGDRESPSRMMRLIAVSCNRVLFSAVVTGVCPSCAPVKLVRGLRRACVEHLAHSASDVSLDPADQDLAAGVVQPTNVTSDLWLASPVSSRGADEVGSPGPTL